MNDSENDDLPPVPAADLLANIDLEQNQLLIDLDSLNDRLEAVLRECAPPAPVESLPVREAPHREVPHREAA